MKKIIGLNGINIMRTFKDITENMDFCPEFLELTIECKSDTSGTEIVTGMLIQERIIKNSIPEWFSAYDIRHSDDDDFCPSTVENSVMVNFFGTILIDRPLEIKNNSYIKIIDYCFKDYSDVAYEEMEAAGIDFDIYFDLWDNLRPISENIKCILEQQKLDNNDSTN